VNTGSNGWFAAFTKGQESLDYVIAKSFLFCDEVDLGFYPINPPLFCKLPASAWARLLKRASPAAPLAPADAGDQQHRRRYGVACTPVLAIMPQI
jgi:hypothetical protein